MIMHMLFAMETTAAKALRIVKAMKSIGLALAVIRMILSIVQMEKIARMVGILEFFLARCSWIFKGVDLIFFNLTVVKNNYFTKNFPGRASVFTFTLGTLSGFRTSSGSNR